MVAKIEVVVQHMLCGLCETVDTVCGDCHRCFKWCIKSDGHKQSCRYHQEKEGTEQ